MPYYISSISKLSMWNRLKKRLNIYEHKWVGWVFFLLKIIVKTHINTLSWILNGYFIKLFFSIVQHFISVRQKLMYFEKINKWCK